MPNSYQVDFEAGTCETSGYLLVQPFRLNAGGQLQPTTGQAKLLVQLHWIRPVDGEFPSFSGSLPQRFRVKINEPTPNTILEISDVSAETIVSSQSVDFGSTLWLLNATSKSTIKFDPQQQYNKPARGAGRHPWQGTLRGSGDGSGNGINVTYAEAVYNAAQDRLLREFAAIGPANADGSGSFFNLIAGATPNQTLPSVEFNDVPRGAKVDLFGTGAGEEQMAEAQGAVFAFNGVFKKCRPADLMQLIRDLSIPRVADGEMAANAIWIESAWRENRLFRDIAQSVEAASRASETNQESFDTAGSDFEGLLLKGLNARGGPATTLL